MNKPLSLRRTMAVGVALIALTWLGETGDADRRRANGGRDAGLRSGCRMAEAASEQVGRGSRQRHRDGRPRSHLDHSSWRNRQAGRRRACASGDRVRRGRQRRPDLGRLRRRLRVAAAGAWHYRRREGPRLDQRQRRAGHAHPRVLPAQESSCRQIGRRRAKRGQQRSRQRGQRDADARRSPEQRGLRVGR